MMLITFPDSYKARRCEVSHNIDIFLHPRLTIDDLRVLQSRPLFALECSERLELLKLFQWLGEELSAYQC